MSLLDTQLDNVPELETAQDGDERLLTITQWETVAKKTDPSLSNWKIKLEDANDPMLDDIYVYLTVPNNALRATDQKKWIKAANRAKDFFKCFGIPENIESESEGIGNSGRCILGQDYDAQYGTRNTVKEFVKGA